MQNVLTILADAAAPATEAAPQGGGTQMLVILVLMFAAMYFLMIAPQRKRQKQHAKMLSELKTGDGIVTIGGMLGVITNVKEKTFVVRIADGTKVEYLKSAIQEKLEAAADKPAENK